MMIEAVGKDIDKHKASIPIEPTLSGRIMLRSVQSATKEIICVDISLSKSKLQAHKSYMCHTTNGVSPSMEGRKVTSVEVPLQHINLLPSS